jgi:hypothetical protein
MRQQHITHHKRFVPYGPRPNPSLSLSTSLMLGTLCTISTWNRYSLIWHRPNSLVGERVNLKPA